jgi:hypothetical protein
MAPTRQAPTPCGCQQTIPPIAAIGEATDAGFEGSCFHNNIPQQNGSMNQMRSTYAERSVGPGS